MSNESSSGGGVGCITIIGWVLAGYSSYTLGNSVLWVALHTVLGWFYLIYLCAGCGGGLPDLGAPMNGG